MSNPQTLEVEHFTASDYPPVDPLKGCNWMHGTKPVCKEPKFTDSPWCVVCCHEKDCHAEAAK
jgi:hypothetical protein